MAASKRDWLLAGGIAVATLAIALGLLRWLAPQLLGLPVDMQLVRVARELPPFYDGVFRREDYQSRDFILNDPVTVVRARPRFQEGDGMGPNDLLGFRNRTIPNVADVVTIGDSQTYGNNALLEENWPSQMVRHLSRHDPVHYSAATGGWGAIQYLDMATKVTTFQPRVVVVAFYTGNDALDSFVVAYGSKDWVDMQVDASLGPGDVPEIPFPPKPEDRWPVVFDDGVATVFTAKVRLVSNDDHPAVRAGYEIMARAAEEIARVMRPFGIRPVFTALPTKELVFAEKVRRAGLSAPPDYTALVVAEASRIEALAARLRAVEGAVFVDVLGPMSEATLAGERLYVDHPDGHPGPEGYAIIGRTLAAAIEPLLAPRQPGLFFVGFSATDQRLALVEPDGVWYFADAALAQKNGWEMSVQRIFPRDLAGLARCGFIREVDTERFGPGAVERAGPACGGPGEGATAR